MAGGTSLIIKILADASAAQKELKATEGHVGGLGDATKSMGKVMAAGAAAGVAGLVALGVGAFNAAEESAKIGRETERVIKTTGAAAWISAGQVGDLASAISDKTGADDEAIQSGENLLLTFTNVQNVVGDGNNVFDRATEAALDMSTALGTDMSGAAIQLGKALNDPIKGMTALSKAGVSFSQDQKDQIKLMQESGDLLGAQKIVLGEVEKEFKGAAEAAGTPLDKLKVSIGNLQESIGSLLIPAVSAAATILQNTLGAAISGATDFFSKHQAVVEALAATGLAALAASYLHVIEANARLVAQGAIEFFVNLGNSVSYSVQFMKLAIQETGILQGTFIGLSATALPAIIAMAALAATVYAVRSAMDTSSESAEDFYSKIQKDVNLSSFDSIREGADKVDKKIRDLRRSIDAGSGFGDMAKAAADLLIPFHDVENSLTDQQKELTTLNEKQQAQNEKVTEAKGKLEAYAEAAVLAANGLEGVSASTAAAAIESQGLTIDIGKVTTEMEAIAKSKKIKLVDDGAVDQVTALWEKTKLTSATTIQMSEAQEKYNDAASTAKDKVDAYKASLDALTGAHMSAAQAETNFSQNTLTLMGTLSKNTEAIRGMANQTDASAASTLAQVAIINTNNKAIQDNVKSAIDLANATYKEEQQRVGSTAAMAIATDGLNEHRNQLIKVMTQMGYTEIQAKAYIDRLGLTPANIQTQVQLDNDKANDKIGDTQWRLDKVTGTYVAVIDANTTPAEKALSNLMNLFRTATSEASERAHRGTQAVLPGSPVLVPAPHLAPMAMSAPAPAPVYNINIAHTGLGVDSPRLQRDLVEALRRYDRRNGRGAA